METSIPLRLDDESARKIVEDTNPELANALKKLLLSKQVPKFPILSEEIETAKRWNLSSLPSLWERLKDELIELSNESTADSDQMILSIILGQNGPLSKHLSTEEDWDKINNFVNRYRVIIWLLYYGNLERNNIEKILVGSGRLDILGDIPLRLTSSMIKYIRDFSTANYLKDLVDDNVLKAPKVDMPANYQGTMPFISEGTMWWWLVNGLLLREYKEWIIDYIRISSNAELLLALLDANILLLDDEIDNGSLTIKEIIFAYSLLYPNVIKKLLADKRFDLSNKSIPIILVRYVNPYETVNTQIESLELLLDDGRMKFSAYTEDLYKYSLYSLELISFLLSRKELKPIPSIDKFYLKRISPDAIKRLLDEPGYINTISTSNFDDIYIVNARAFNSTLYETLYKYRKPSYFVLLQLIKDAIRGNEALKYIIKYGFEGKIDNYALYSAENKVTWELLVKNNIFDASLEGQEDLYRRLSRDDFISLLKSRNFQKAIGKESVAQWKSRLQE